MDRARLPHLEPDDLVVQPLELSETIPSSWYTDPAFAELDRRAALECSWQYVGPAHHIQDAGSYLSANVAGNPVVVVRDKDATLRAFYNVCRHRGGPLVTNECGAVTMLQCKYHGWTYRLDGMLRGVPRFDRTELFDKRDYGLTALDVRVWNGLVFVRIRKDAGSPALEQILHGIEERIAPMQLGSLRFNRRITYDVGCNWKVYVDNYLEGYHLPLVHPELCDVLDYANYITETSTYHSLQYSPMRGDDSAGERAYYYFVFPNFMLNILPGRLQTNVVCPLESGRCRVHFDYFYSPEIIENEPDRITSDQDFAERVQQEDIEICLHVQRGLASDGYDKGRFSYDAENGVHHFQGLLKECYARYLEGVDK